jgi:competence ComEA-like helix-hairpin-helix protein
MRRNPATALYETLDIDRARAGAVKWRRSAMSSVPLTPNFRRCSMIVPLAFVPVAVTLLMAPALAATVTRTETITASAPVGGKVNINTASVKDLMMLSGVGKKVAEKIVEYRGAHGAFRKAEDVRKVEGLGDALWERNKDRIVVK